MRLQLSGHECLACLCCVTDVSVEPKKAAVKRWGKSRPYPATVVAVEGLCAITDKDDKNTMRLELDLGDSGLSYLPGDALGIWPSNGEQYVDELMAALAAQPDEQIPVPGWAYESEATQGAEKISLKQALTSFYDLK